MSIRYLILFFALIPYVVFSEPLIDRNSFVVPRDQTYYTFDIRNTRLIFTEKNRDAAEHTAAVENLLQPLYEQSFGYVMDDRLNVGLMSSYNQISNGFSTQLPLNSQINYIGGAQVVDYFASSSWLDTLLFHETAHNYQINAKDNAVSRSLFGVLGNGIFLTPIIPAIIPNEFESSFILEGNAVLNESWHGRGGRLYSGRFKALTLAQAGEGYLTPERLFNSTLNFPYGESDYIFGGYYQYYLAQEYGLEVVNKYFKVRSQNWYVPFHVNEPMKAAFGDDFDTTFKRWVENMSLDSVSMKMASGKVITTSKFYSPLNTQNGKIMFMANPDGVRQPLLVTYYLKDGAIKIIHTGHDQGKIFVVDGTVYTVSGRHTSPWRIYQGLYDNDAFIKSDTEGRIIQGYMKDGTQVYFKVDESFIEPKLYVGEKYYSDVNSSVLVIDDDVYYFSQGGEKRTLYRNRDALLSFDGFYGIVTDVDVSGAVYFIANTKYGSSLYRYKDGVTQRALAADNVIDAKLTDDDHVLTAAISADGYYYTVESIVLESESPYVEQLFWDLPDENMVSQKAAFSNASPIGLNLNHRYGIFNNIRYSGATLDLSTKDVTDEKTGDDNIELLYDLDINYRDPFTLNSVDLWALRDDDLSEIVGIGYENNQSLVLVGLDVYKVINNGLDNNTEPAETRDYGFAAELRVPFIKKGYWDAELAAAYYQDYHLQEREPLSLQLNISRIEQHGLSILPNKKFDFSVFRVEDRGGHNNGGEINLLKDLPYEIYVGASTKISSSDGGIISDTERRGVEIREDSDFINNDPSGIELPTLKTTTYAEKVTKNEISIEKTVNYSAYYFKFPLSIRRESVALKYRNYDIINSDIGRDVNIDQSILSLNVDILIANKFPSIFTLEYVRNNNEILTEKNEIITRFKLGY